MFEPRIPSLVRTVMIAILLAGISTPVVAQVIDRVLVVVNEGVITESEFIDTLRQAIAEMRARGAAIPERRVVEEQVMEQLILTRIQLQIADRLDIQVTPAQVDRTIADIAERQGLSASELLKRVQLAGMDSAKHRTQIEEQIRIQRLIDREIRRRIIVSETEIDERVAVLSRDTNDDEIEYEVAHISLLIENAKDSGERAEKLALAKMIENSIKQGEDFGVLARQHSESPTATNGGNLGWRGAEQLPDLFLEAIRDLGVGGVSNILDTPSGIHLVKLTGRRGGGQDLVEQWNVRHILIPVDAENDANEARETAKLLLKRLAQGEEFADLARVHSADSASRVKGGDLGWLSPGDTVPKFEEAIRNLEIGKIGDPVETRFGFHIVEVLDRRKQNLGASLIRQQAERQIREEKGEEAYNQWLQKLRSEAFVRFRLKPG